MKLKNLMVAAMAVTSLAFISPAMADHHMGDHAKPASEAGMMKKEMHSKDMSSDHHKAEKNKHEAAAVVGQPAPDVTFMDTNGIEHSIAGFKGNIVVLEWTNPECPFDKKHYGTGNMQKLQKEATDAGVIWVSVNSGAEGKQGYFADAAAANAYVGDVGGNMTAYVRDVNGMFGHTYGAMTTPHMYVIDAEGTLAYAGAIDSIPSAQYEDVEKAENYVMAAVKALKAGEDVAASNTKPYGCSVKY